MEGALPPCALLFLLLVSQPAEQAGADAGAMELSGILGGSVTFPLGIPAEQFVNAAWSVNTTKSLVTVIAGTPPTVVVIEKTNYKGRLGTPETSYSLQLTGLRMEDAGLYTARVNTDKGPVTKRFTLRVHPKPPAPASPASLSYCRVKGLILLLVLGALSAGIITVHVLPAGSRDGAESRGASAATTDPAGRGPAPAGQAEGGYGGHSLAAS